MTQSLMEKALQVYENSGRSSGQHQLTKNKKKKKELTSESLGTNAIVFARGGGCLL